MHRETFVRRIVAVEEVEVEDKQTRPWLERRVTTKKKRTNKSVESVDPKCSGDARRINRLPSC